MILDLSKIRFEDKDIFDKQIGVVNLCQDQGSVRPIGWNSWNIILKITKIYIISYWYGNWTVKYRKYETCTKYADSDKFNDIPREGNTAIPIKSYKDEFCEHIIINGMWHVFYLPYPSNNEKKWDILLHQSRFSFEYLKRHVESLQKGSEADQYLVQNLT